MPYHRSPEILLHVYPCIGLESASIPLSNSGASPAKTWSGHTIRAAIQKVLDSCQSLIFLKSNQYLRPGGRNGAAMRKQQQQSIAYRHKIAIKKGLYFSRRISCLKAHFRWASITDYTQRMQQTSSCTISRQAHPVSSIKAIINSVLWTALLPENWHTTVLETLVTWLSAGSHPS